MGEAVLRLASRPATDMFIPADAIDLVWFHNDAEAEFGISSTQGGIESLLNRRSISESAIRDIATGKRKLHAYLKSKGASRALVDHLDPGFLRALEELDCEQVMHVKGDEHGNHSDPFESDHILSSVRRARRIRETLKRIAATHRMILHAVHGPQRGDVNLNRALEKKFGPLVEIVVTLVAAAREEGDLPARDLTLRKAIKDDSFITMQKRQAERLYTEATTVYGKAKVGWDRHEQPKLTAKEPVTCRSAYVRLGQTVYCAKPGPHVDGHWFPSIEVD